LATLINIQCGKGKKKGTKRHKGNNYFCIFANKTILEIDDRIKTGTSLKKPATCSRKQN